MGTCGGLVKYSRPRGSYVRVQETPDDAQSEQECTTPLLRPEIVSESSTIQTGSVTDEPSLEHVENTDEQTDSDISDHNDPIQDFDYPLGMDIEDFLSDTPEGIDKDVEPEMFSKWLELEGRQVLKTSVVATLSTAFSKKLSV